jgi:hypothetical protein
MIRYVALPLAALLICTGAAPRPRVADTISVANRSGSPQRDFPLQFGRPFLRGEIAHAPRVLLNGKPIPTQADVKNRYPDGSVEFAVVAVLIPVLPPGAKQVLSFVDQPGPSNTPLSREQMLDPAYDFDAVISVTGTAPGSQPQQASARAMLEAGDYRLWTSGPIAQTIFLGDDGATRKYDLGFGDNFRPLRPRFVATFWPARREVLVRAIGENDLTTEIEDLAYTLQIKAGAAHPHIVYAADLTDTRNPNPKQHWAMSNWTRRFWLPGSGSGAPSDQVDIDYNLAYLEETRWLPNFDTAIKPAAALIAGEYALWTGKPHDLYDGTWDRGLWQSTMSSAGERQELGPYPSWDVLWLYTGDWRMRQMALGMDDLAAAFPGNLREGDPTKRLNRSDPAGSGTGLGHAISIADRRTICLYTPSLLTYSGTKLGDRVKIVGPLNLRQPWSFDGAHQPQPWFVPYVLTGDPWYLNQAYLWAGFSAARYNGAVTVAWGRGPTGAEGVINDELRGAGWVLRNRAETALMAPDADPEKAWFTTLANDALARWEGSLGIAGTVYDGTAVKAWGAETGNFYAQTHGPANGQAPTLGNWESNGNPTKANPTIAENERRGVYMPGAAGSFTAPWMQNYVLYALGRVKEIGFAAGPLLTHTARWFTGMIDNSGYPELVAMYQMPVEKKGGGFFPDWPSLVAALEPAWLTGKGYGGVSLPAFFARHLNADGYAGWAVAAAAQIAGEPGGAQAWTWMHDNVYAKIRDWATNAGGPKWAIVPRPEGTLLTAMPLH